MHSQIRKSIHYIVFISFILSILIFFFAYPIPLKKYIHWKIYDRLVSIKYKFTNPPLALQDILLVTIDNETLENMTQRWPYSRSCFAEVIKQLKKAGARVIAFDFVFLGKSTEQDDAILKKAIEEENKVILASVINEDGALQFFSIPALSEKIPSGVITKLQDSDGTIRRNLTYLVSKKEEYKGFLSWEMQILKVDKSIDLSSIRSNASSVSFQNDSGERWVIPVDLQTKSFLINFCSHTIDFKRLSFYQVLKGGFDPTKVKDKVVLVGTLTSLLGDLHNTPLGFLPGLTLSANALLTLYSHNFIKETPKPLGILVLILGVILSIYFILSFNTKRAYLFILVELFLFFLLSYILLLQGYIWNYFFFPLVVLLCSLLSKGIRKKYWT